MAEHLSDLQLDELAVGEIDLGEHVAGCESCRQRLERLLRQRDEIACSARFEQTYQRLARAHAERRSSRRPWMLFGPITAAVAVAAVMLVVMPRAPEGDRIKGAPRLAVVRADGRRAPSFHVGEQVSLSAAGAGLDHLVVFSRGEDGALERLWPLDSSEESELVADGSGLLQPPFEVTPGDTLLLGVFSREHVDAAEARRILEAVPDQGPDVVRVGPSTVIVRQKLSVEGNHR